MIRAWIRRTATVTLFASVAATGIAFLTASPAAAEDPAKNLKVLPTTMSRAEIKKEMKKMAAALGQQCDFCHDTDDFAKDSEKKEIGRAMLKMTAEINKNHFEGKPKVGCITCHNGQKEPKHP